MSEFTAIVLSMSDWELDARVKPLIAKWSAEPTPLEILEPLDMCIHCALASGFVVAALQTIYGMACKNIGTTHEEVVKLATWRHR